VPFEGIEDFVCRAAAVDGHHSPSDTGAGRQDAFEAASLNLEMGAVVRSTVQPDLTDVTRLPDQRLKEWKFGMTLVGELWVESQGGSNPRSVDRQLERAAPSPGRRGDG
jgi:hypothetical protein